MTVKRGDIVLMSAPFATGTGSKIRPLLVIQNDTNNARMANTIVAFITTNLTRVSEPTQVLIEVGTTEGIGAGLTRDSVVSCENLLTVVQADILRTIGLLPDKLMDQVNDALKESLALA